MNKGVRPSAELDPQSDPPRDLSAGPFELHDQAGDSVDFRFSLFRNGEVAAMLNVGLVPFDWRKEKEFATFIVKAVNAHDELVRLVRDMVRVEDAKGLPASWYAGWFAHARATLAALSEGLPTPEARDEVSRP